MQQFKFYLSVVGIFLLHTAFSQTHDVDHFSKVIVSPHIQVTFIKGATENVTIENSTVSEDKINIEVNHGTLHIYLDGAKEITKNEKADSEGYGKKRPLYQGTVVKATITYKTLDDLSVRGEETQLCKSILKGEKFSLKIYGESHVILTEVDLGELHTTIYGESTLDINAGTIKTQRYTAYGESKINSVAVNSINTRITSYGESNFQVNSSDEIKITAFGETRLKYKGDAVVEKGITIGEVHIARID